MHRHHFLVFRLKTKLEMLVMNLETHAHYVMPNPQIEMLKNTSIFTTFEVEFCRGYHLPQQKSISKFAQTETNRRGSQLINLGRLSTELLTSLIWIGT